MCSHCKFLSSVRPFSSDKGKVYMKLLQDYVGNKRLELAGQLLSLLFEVRPVYRLLLFSNPCSSNIIVLTIVSKLSLLLL